MKRCRFSCCFSFFGLFSPWSLGPRAPGPYPPTALPRQPAVAARTRTPDLEVNSLPRSTRRAGAAATTPEKGSGSQVFPREGRQATTANEDTHTHTHTHTHTPPGMPAPLLRALLGKPRQP